MAIILGRGMGLTNGEIQNTYDGLMACWVTKNGGTGYWKGEGNFEITKWPNKIWKVTLPVVDCDPNDSGKVSVENCSRWLELWKLMLSG